jgi:geranylgeranyl diphosphate synthase, type II
LKVERKKSASSSSFAFNDQPSTLNQPPMTLKDYLADRAAQRLRPVLCLAAAEACGGNTADALAPACAVELMHTYSLVHDDLPAMDDDDLRRGRPTCHKVYGEGMAVLCGDAILTESFLVLSQAPSNKRYSTRDYITELAKTGGSRKLFGGQVMAPEGEGKKSPSANWSASMNPKPPHCLPARCASVP